MATLGLPVADPGFFSGGGSNVQSGCANLYLPVMFMFSQVSVCLGGVYPIAYWDTPPPPGPEADTTQADMPWAE